jgi:hypothetical protein
MERAGARNVAEQIFGATPGRTLALLRAAWPRAVGPDLARRTEVVALEGDTLRIRVPDAGWRKGLLRMRREILIGLYRTAGGLAPRRLSFVEAPWAGEPAPEASLESEKPAAPLAPPSGLVAPAAAIVDPEERARFLATAARYLDRFKPS